MVRRFCQRCGLAGHPAQRRYRRGGEDYQGNGQVGDGDDVNVGNSVVAIRVPDTSRVPGIRPAIELSQGRLTQGPNTSRSLHNSSRNTLALGNTPARACTAVVINPSGDQHDHRGQHHHRGVGHGPRGDSPGPFPCLLRTSMQNDFVLTARKGG